METILFSLNASSKAKPKKAKYRGRDYLVAPMTMLVPGVLPGSQGPILYPAELVGNGVDRWNGMPIVVYHPKDATTSEFITARQPNVLNQSGVGEVYNASFTDKLQAEGWFDIDRTKEVDIRVYNSLAKGEKIELSTGLFGSSTAVEEKDQDKAVFNGKQYKATLTAYTPDHLAVLPDEVGACSLKDGCGVLANYEKLVEDLVLTDNELDHDQIRQAIYTALRSQLKQSDPYCYILFVYDNYFIYEQNGVYLKQSYKKTSSTEGVTLGDKKPLKVVKEISFVPVANEQDTLTNNQTEEKTMAFTAEQRKEHVTFLVTNCDCWKGQEEVVGKFSDTTLANLKINTEKLKNQEAVLLAAQEGFGTINPTELKAKAVLLTNSLKKEEEKVTPPVTPPNTPPITNTTPPALSAEDRAALEFGKSEMNRQKADLVGRIVANVNDPQKKASLATMYTNMDINQLQDVLLTIPQMNPLMPGGTQMPTVNGVPIPDYSGQGGGFLPTVNRQYGQPAFIPGKPLELETLTFETAK